MPFNAIGRNKILSKISEHNKNESDKTAKSPVGVFGYCE